MYIVAPEPVLTANLINPSLKYVCIYVYPSTVARQRFGKNFGSVIFYPVRGVSKVNMRLVLLRTSCFMSQYVRPWTIIKAGTQFSQICTRGTYRICWKIEVYRRMEKNSIEVRSRHRNFPIMRRPLFFRRCNFSRWLSAANSQAGKHKLC
jgi:hypothetical protein